MTVHIVENSYDVIAFCGASVPLAGEYNAILVMHQRIPDWYHHSDCDICILVFFQMKAEGKL